MLYSGKCTVSPCCVPWDPVSASDRLIPSPQPNARHPKKATASHLPLLIKLQMSLGGFDPLLFVNEAGLPYTTAQRKGLCWDVWAVCASVLSAEAAMSPIVPGRVRRQPSYPNRPCLLQQL